MNHVSEILQIILTRSQIYWKKTWKGEVSKRIHEEKRSHQFFRGGLARFAAIRTWRDIILNQIDLKENCGSESLID
jgi:hypothetical protein